MISDDGRLKVLDFGLAKWINHRSDADPSELETAVHTQEGIIVGTAPYMSPEQASGQPVDSRSDIFSFGIVLYQLISGHLPFTGTSPIHILTQILHADPPELDSTSCRLCESFAVASKKIAICDTHP